MPRWAALSWTNSASSHRPALCSPSRARRGGRPAQPVASAVECRLHDRAGLLDDERVDGERAELLVHAGVLRQQKCCGVGQHQRRLLANTLSPSKVELTTAASLMPRAASTQLRESPSLPGWIGETTSRPGG